METKMSAVLLKRLKWFCFVFPALLLVGCNNSTPTPELGSSASSKSSNVAAVAHRPVPEAELSSYKFEPAMLVMAGDERISVEEPGYACPTLFDMDKDGSEDLIVGQFNEGKMKWYRNLSSPGETPTYAAGQWIGSAEDPAEVPGVS